MTGEAQRYLKLFSQHFCISCLIFHRFSGDFSYSRQCHIKNLKNQNYKETVNGYAPYFEYALDYSAPTEGGKPGAAVANNGNKSQTSAINSATLPHYTNPVTTTGNLSLPRNRNDMQQQPQQSTAQMGNGFLGKFRV